MKAMIIKKIKRILYSCVELPLKRLSHQRKPSITPIQANIIAALQQDGIAVVGFEELFGSGTLAEVETAFAAFQEHPQVQPIKTGNAGATNPNYKNYNIRASSIEPVISADSVLLRTGLSTQLGTIASTYLQELALMRYADYWLSIPSGERNYSQNWHRDPEDKRILKVFVYLNDVSETNGAFEYVKGSHFDGPYNSVFPYDDEHPNNYPDEQELRKQIPEAAFTINTGKKGTVILCDTHGFHRGGFCKQGDRWLMTFMYNRGSLVMSNQFKVDFPSKLTQTQRRFYATFG